MPCAPSRRHARRGDARKHERDGVPLATAGAAVRGRTMDAGGRAEVSLRNPHGLGRRMGATTARAPRRADARGRRMSEASAGGFGVVYPVLKAMEESGRIRRGYFVAGLGATQFALPGALDLLRSLREPSPDGAAIRSRSSCSRRPIRPIRTVRRSGFLPSAARSPARIGRRDGHPGRRRDAALSRSRRSAAADVSARERAASIETRARDRAGAARTCRGCRWRWTRREGC